MLRATWKAGSLRFWIAVAMALTVLPLLASAIIAFTVLHRGVIADFEDVAVRERDQLAPAQQLRLELWEATDPVLLYLSDSQPAEAAEYRAARERIEAAFASVHAALARDADGQILVERARADWTDADRLAMDILSKHWPPGAAGAVEEANRFRSAIAAGVDRLAALNDLLRRDLDADHADAGRSYERAIWISGIAGGVSLFSMMLGVFVIGRFLITSVDRLVEGAARFAAGDRDHQIDVQVPPELGRVADEFNRMILRIRESEAALAELARRDRLTGLRNRRAFDEVIASTLAGLRRADDDVALLAVDIDHFKQVNDTHGHAAGDEVLRAVATALGRGVREADSVFRIGGEEFAVLLTGANRARALELAERLRADIAARPVSAAGQNVTVTISIGAAMAKGGGTADALLAEADAALYRAKESGRNRVAAADP